MLSASLYIVASSARNRFSKRLKRLKEPRYLLGAVVGIAYFYFAIFARTRGRTAALDAARTRNAATRRRPGPDPAATVALLSASGPALAGLAFLVMGIVAWVLPFDSGLLDFSEAETDFLFTAPISRRSLLMHRMMRSQLGILFGSVIVSFAAGTVTGWTRLRISIAMWLVFVTIKLYFTVVTLARTRLTADKSATRVLAWAPLALLLAMLTTAGTAIVRAFSASPVESARDAFQRLGTVSLTGASSIAMWPFVTLARPLFAPDWSAYVVDMGWGVLILAGLVVWVLATDDAFQEAAAHAAARRAEKAQSKRASFGRARTTGLALALHGRPETAFFWKNGVQTLRLAGLTALRIAVAMVVIVVASTSAAVNALHLQGAAAAACIVSIALAGFAAILGPQVVRTDLRSDLTHLDVLKTWPVRAGAVIRGEMAWPALMLTIVGWIAIGSAAAFSAAAFPRLALTTRLSVSVAAFLLMPAFVCAQYLIQNAAAVIFPAWVPLGDQRPRGVDAMGQRIIMLAGVLLAVALMLLPGVIAGGVLWFAFQRIIGPPIFVVGALVCTAIVAIEILAGTEVLGPLYERLDILAVERAE